MIINAYLDVTDKEWEDIKKHVKPDMYRIIKKNNRKHNRCDNCSMYTACSVYEGFCLETNELVCGNGTCDSYQ